MPNNKSKATSKTGTMPGKTSDFRSTLAARFSYDSTGPPVGSKPEGIVKQKVQDRNGSRGREQVASPGVSKSYAPPSKYAHLPQTLPDAIAENLLVLSVGHNPGVKTATAGHAYAHKSNRYWRLVSLEGIDSDITCTDVFPASSLRSDP
jgi:hypothetical protein